MCWTEEAATKFPIIFYCIKYEGNFLDAVEQDEKLCDNVEAVIGFRYLGDNVSESGGCEAAVTARAICGWVWLRECCELLYRKMFPLKLKGAIYWSYVWPSVLEGSEAWCLKESKMFFL